MDYGLPILQDPWELDRASIAFQSVKVTRVEVIAPISFKGDSRRWRTNPLNRQSQPICNCLQPFDQSTNLKHTMPIYSRSMPYSQWLWLSRRAWHAPTKTHSRHFTSFAPWIRQLHGTSRLASLGDGRG